MTKQEFIKKYGEPVRIIHTDGYHLEFAKAMSNSWSLGNAMCLDSLKNLGIR